MSAREAPLLRRARREDVPAIVALLQADALGAGRETPRGEPLPDSYYAAFDAIDRDPDAELVVAEIGGRVAGSCHMTVRAYLSYKGARAAEVENVHVAADARGSGVGRALMERAIARARERGCHRVQLASSKSRTDSHRFYERLGFRATHEGMKLVLRP